MCVVNNDDIWTKKGVHGSSSIGRRRTQFGHNRGGSRRDVGYFEQVQIFRVLQGTGETTETIPNYTAT